MPLKDTLKSIKAKLTPSDSGSTSTTPEGSKRNSVSGPAGGRTSQTASPRPSGDLVRTAGSGANSPKRNSSPGPVDTFLGKAKSLRVGAPGSSLAHPTDSGNKTAPGTRSKHAEKVKRRKAKKEQRRKEVEERMEREGLGGKQGKMASRAEPSSKYRNETFGFYPLMRSDPKQTESESWIGTWWSSRTS
jgi:hypothetical protein